jgi:hypothetical protein
VLVTIKIRFAEDSLAFELSKGSLMRETTDEKESAMERERGFMSRQKEQGKETGGAEGRNLEDELIFGLNYSLDITAALNSEVKER